MLASQYQTEWITFCFQLVIFQDNKWKNVLLKR